MKNKFIFSLLTLISFNTFAGDHFTNISLVSEKYLFAAVKSVRPEMEMVSHLLEINLESMKEQKINLPKEISDREVVGLFPARKNVLIVLTQETRGGGDRPQVHRFDTANKKWTKLAEVDCISFAKVNLEVKKIVFSCEETSDEGTVKMVSREVTVDSEFNKTGEINLPVLKEELGNIEVAVAGEKLRVKKGKLEKSFTP